MCEYKCVKDLAEPILAESGFRDITWLGPVKRTTPYGAINQVVALWFRWIDRMYMVPFAGPWDQWKRLDVDAQIAEWMKRTQEDVDVYLIASPDLRLKVVPVKCDCGACKTSNPTLHSFWCSAYNKETK